MKVFLILLEQLFQYEPKIDEINCSIQKNNYQDTIIITVIISNILEDELENPKVNLQFSTYI
jgi:hypothetical protein